MSSQFVGFESSTDFCSTNSVDLRILGPLETGLSHLIEYAFSCSTRTQSVLLPSTPRPIIGETLQEMSKKSATAICKPFQLSSSMVTKSPVEGRSTWVIFGQAMINSFGRGMQWKATLGELIPLRKQALIALHRKEAMVGWGDDFETSPWKEVDGEKWRE